MLLAESLERLDSSAWIDAIVVAVPADWEEAAIVLAEELVASKVAAVVTGGATRAESVRAALAEVPDDALVVIVHDAARPLVDDAVIERVLASPRRGRTTASCPACRSPTPSSASREASSPRPSIVPRSSPCRRRRRSRRPSLRAAYRGSEPIDATDCASLVEARGGRIRVVDGDLRLLKITTAADLALVESWL